MKCDIFENRSTITQICVNPLDYLRPVMKSIEIEVQGANGTSSGLSKPNLLCLVGLLRWQASQVFTHSEIVSVIFGQYKFRETISSVLSVQIGRGDVCTPLPRNCPLPSPAWRKQ